MDCIYVVMWERWNGIDCTAADLYVSLDPDKAQEFMDRKARTENRYEFEWDESADMWRNTWEHGWDKLYIDVRPLDEEL